MEATNENRVTREEIRDLGEKLQVLDRDLSPAQRGLLRYALTRAAGQEVEGYASFIEYPLLFDLIAISYVSIFPS